MRIPTEDHNIMTTLDLISMSWHSVMLLSIGAVSEAYNFSFSFTDKIRYFMLLVLVTDCWAIVPVILDQFDCIPALSPSICQVSGPKVGSNKRLVVCVQLVRTIRFKPENSVAST